MQSTATGPVPAAPVRAGRPQAVSCLRHSLAPIAREAGPAFPGSRSPRLDIRGVAGGEGLKPSPTGDPSQSLRHCPNSSPPGGGEPVPRREGRGPTPARNRGPAPPDPRSPRSGAGRACRGRLCRGGFQTTTTAQTPGFFIARIPAVPPRTERSGDPGTRAVWRGRAGRLWSPALPPVGRGGTGRVTG